MSARKGAAAPVDRRTTAERREAVDGAREAGSRVMLAEVERKAAALDAARRELEAAVVYASVAGANVTELARSAGVTRPTVYSWLAPEVVERVTGLAVHVTVPAEPQRPVVRQQGGAGRRQPAARTGRRASAGG